MQVNFVCQSYRLRVLTLGKVKLAANLELD